jgi:D-beta-D-heptose 7-phosphate kinase/D-beta-D-heptose 1-phosphate adenosyltransferase
MDHSDEQPLDDQIKTMQAILDWRTAPRILVVGDLMLDRYTYGEAERISPEGPVVVLRADSTRETLGGAALVAHFLAALDVEVTCAGVVGEDVAGHAVRRLLYNAGVLCDDVVSVPDRLTTVKERFIGKATGKHAHQMLRVDREVRTAVPPAIEDTLSRSLISKMAQFDVVLISDYAKGVCTESVCQRIITAARSAKLPVLIDPARSADCSRYRNATGLKPNRTEVGLATGAATTSSSEAIAAGERLCHDLNLLFVLVTLDRDGIALVRPGSPSRLFPTRARAIYDITGAGDMVLAMSGIALARGASAEIAAQMANVAAGLEVERVGASPVSRSDLRNAFVSQGAQLDKKLLTLEELVQIANYHRNLGQSIVFTNGCFDLLHAGHIHYLAEAASMGDLLVVGLNSDASVRRLKGFDRPILSQEQRAAMLAALQCVDHVVVFDEDTPHEILRRLRPEVLTKGGTYSVDEVVGREIVESYGGVIRVTTQVEGISTTKILAQLQATRLIASDQ